MAKTEQQKLRSEFEKYKELIDQSGTKEEKFDFFAVLSSAAHYAGEYDDLFSGKKKREVHWHHNTKDLLSAVMVGKRTLRKIIRSITDRGKHEQRA